MEMEPQGGGETPSVIGDLFDGPHRFGFFQAVRLLELDAAFRRRRGRPSRSLGRDGPPDCESVRFHQGISLAFAPTEVTKLEQRVDCDNLPVQADMTISFLGLLGQEGALPRHYTSFANEQARLGDYTFTAFCDLFLHRSASLFFRAWLKNRVPVSTELDRIWNQKESSEGISSILLSLLGLGIPGMTESIAVDSDALLFYAGHFSHKTCRLVHLEATLSDYFQLPVSIEQFVGNWISIPQHSQSRFGAGALRLGKNVVSGTRIWDQSSRIRFKIGPLTIHQFREFLPGSSRLIQMRDIIHLSLGMELDYEVQLVLMKEHVPPFQFDISTGSAPSRLGYGTWATSRPAERDAGDLVLSSHTIRALQSLT